ncbi:MAG: GNAT family N-acetyltransferase [Woeseiaceae bacterium]|nr:GNAT family N-acetyltransferase [Woeseiaceae bacterium]
MSSVTTAPDEAVIRRATREDVDAIHELVVELAVATGMQHKVRSTAADFLAYGFGADPHFHALVAESNGRIIGLCLYFYEFSTWLGSPGLYIQDLVVRRQVRSAGLGRQLVAETVRLSRLEGATHLRLSVDVNNEGAIRFYQKLGMKSSSDERIFHAHGAAFQKLAEIA